MTMELFSNHYCIQMGWFGVLGSNLPVAHSDYFSS